MHLDELLGNAAWVRRLALRLLGDRGLAEDVAQETWIAGLRSGPRGAELRPWLARVVENFALQRLRSERARGSRERAVSRPEPLPSSSETVERAELHARLVQAVLALDEPYRTTILWRYFEELDDREIARRAGIDVATVRSRVARARTKLRDELTRRGGEPPERWLAALVPWDALHVPLDASAQLAPVASGTVIGGTGAVLMSAKWIGATAAAAMLAAALWWAWPESAGEPSGPASPHTLGAAASLEVADPSAVEGALDASARSAVANDAAQASPAPSAAPASLRGVVLDEDGRLPLAAARVSHRKGSETERSGLAVEPAKAALAVTDAQGRFEIERPREDDVGLWFERDGYFPLKLSPSELPRGLEPIEAVLAPLGRIELALTDENGAPVADAPVTYMLDVGRGSQDQRWAHRRQVAGGTTGADGRLSITGLPCGMPITLRGARTSDDDWLGVVTIDLHARVHHHDARLPSKPKVRGRIVDASGRPAADVGVRWQPFPLGYRDPVQATAGGDGRFELAGLRPGKAEVRFGPPGTPPRVVTLEPGEALDLGDLAIPDVVALGGRIVSRFGAVDDELVVRAFRGGRQLLEMRTQDGAFAGAVTAGELELLVARGGWWEEELVTPHRILARVVLPEPAPNVEITLDDGRGAIEFVLAGPVESRAAGRSVDWSVFPAGGGPPAVAGGSAAVGADGRLRIGPVIPGRYRARVALNGVGAAFSAELTVVASAITDGGTLTLQPVVFAARVVDAAGLPVPHAKLKLQGPRPGGEATTGEDGRARIEWIEPGYAQVFIDHGKLGRLVREDFLIEPGPPVEHVFVLAGLAVIEGTLTSGAQPVPSTSVNLQPSGSNDTWNASTDAGGRFRLEGLPAGNLRVWVHGHLMTSVEVAAGETRRLDLEIGTPRTLRFERDGAPLDGLFSVAAIGRDAAALAARCWTVGEEQDESVAIEMPDGPVLFSVSCAATGSQYSFVALGTGAEETVAMPRGAVTIATNGAWHGPLPRARLLELDGNAVIGMWGRPIELALEVDADGRARVPCLPPHARVELRGFDSRGAPFAAEVTTGADGFAELRWP